MPVPWVVWLIGVHSYHREVGCSVLRSNLMRRHPSRDSTHHATPHLSRSYRVGETQKGTYELESRPQAKPKKKHPTKSSDTTKMMRVIVDEVWLHSSQKAKRLMASLFRHGSSYGIVPSLEMKKTLVCAAWSALTMFVRIRELRYAVRTGAHVQYPFSKSCDKHQYSLYTKVSRLQFSAAPSHSSV